MLPPKAPSWVSEFRKFIMRGNVVDLAVGLIIGVAFTGVVSSLVKDVFNPFLGLLTGIEIFKFSFPPIPFSLSEPHKSAGVCNSSRLSLEGTPSSIC